MPKKKERREKDTKQVPKLIDILQESLVKAGYEVNRDSWVENENSTPPNDKCSWLDIQIPHNSDGDKRYTVHLYFSNDSTNLEELSIFKSKRKSKWTRDKLVASKRD